MPAAIFTSLCMFRNVKPRSKAPNDLCLHYITITFTFTFTFTGFKNSNVVYKVFLNM